MKDTELFELCKEVYERFPKWGDVDFVWLNNIPREEPSYTSGNKFVSEAETPAYTSDYLFKKLPRGTQVRKSVRFDGYVARTRLSGNAPRKAADTPLKALLKLTLALHEAKELT